jgi:hypothetical protein
VSTDVSEEHIPSIFRSEEISSARNQQAISRFFNPKEEVSTLKMEASGCPDTLVAAFETLVVSYPIRPQF